MALAVKSPVYPEGERRLRSRTPVLNSWKDIAGYLKCGVRTAQRWERDLGLPIYRPRPGKRGPVCGLPSEIQIWLRRNKTDGLGQDASGSSTITLAHQLTHQSTELVRITAANTRRQQEHIARLLQTIETLKVRIQHQSRVGRTT
jgi:hypothetical protein